MSTGRKLWITLLALAIGIGIGGSSCSFELGVIAFMIAECLQILQYMSDLPPK